MKQYFYLLALTTELLLSGCTSESRVEQPDVPIPIEFSTYLSNRQNMTRAETTESDLLTYGFGLFATYSAGTTGTDGSYSSTTGPNFMYNQKVWGGSGSEFKYEPVKYWPNETGIDGSNGVVSDHVDVLSFFAYAPYVANAPGTADKDYIADGSLATTATTGITKLTANNATTDPKVYYTLPSMNGTEGEASPVDLLWGVVKTGGTWNNVTGGATEAAKKKTVNLTAGLPFLNLIKPATAQKIQFNFKHALAKITFGTIALANDVVGVGDNGNADAASGTSIVVSEITFSGTGIKNGVLNLNNTTAGEPLWEAVDEPGTAPFFVKISGEQIAATIKDAGAKANQPTGVTKAAQSILAVTTGTDVPGSLLIPNSSQDVTVKIKYYTVTKDANLLGGESRVENEITKELTGLSISGSKAYKINIVIGMTSVKVNAEVDSEWGDAGSQAVDLPQNTQTSGN